jgi:hypothetical protein
MTEHPETLRQLIDEAFAMALQDELSQPLDLARLGAYLRKADDSFSHQRHGAATLRQLVEQVPDKVQLIKDDTVYPPRFFARHLSGNPSHPPAPNSRSVIEPAKAATGEPSALLNDLYEFTYIPEANWPKLAEQARPENWGRDDRLPILINYLRYTFSRLVQERKIAFANTDSGQLASFNTGLVDRRFQPIFALLVPNKIVKVPGKRPWYLEGFCVAGENRLGKQLVNAFKPLPESAYYFENPADGVFDARAEVHVDWEHVIEENVERIPVRLLERTTQGFEVRALEVLSEEEAFAYKQTFAEYIRKDDFAYRMLIQAFDGALALARKKALWNYKTAIPVYHPARNSMSMMLPLSLLTADTVDLALVVERQPLSGNYQGHTIYPIHWAYKNARLIARPESDWLTPTA